MKILFITDTYPPDFGGMARSAKRIVDGLSKTHEIRVISLGEGNAILRVKIHKKDKDTLHGLKVLVEREILQDRPNLLIGFYINFSGYIATYLGQIYSIPSLIAARGNDIERGLTNPQRIPLVQYAINNCSLATSVSKYLINQMLAINPQLQFKVVNNGIDVSEKYNRHEFDGHRLVVGFFGDSRHKKGLDLLLNAMQLLVTLSEEKWKLIVGGKIDDYMINIIESMEQDKFLKIKQFGQVPMDEIEAFYKQIHVMVIPSRYEGLPNVLLESVLRKIPVIHSDHPSMTEFFPERTHITFRNDDYVSLANALQRVRSNYTGLALESAYIHLRNNYSREKELERWKDAISAIQPVS
ncbi:MAG: glycosyltransferase family 4 protein [Candidatus Heimdallarchaeota archaeon]|nr:glycosyltransferase family 4 protein [Candidatus Heimdallarchaeota archaeon]